MLDRFPAEEDPPEPPPAVAAALRDLCRGRGELPGGAAGELELDRLAERWGTLRQGLAQLGRASRRTVAWGPYRSEIVCRGDSLVVVQAARADVSHRMELWLRLLLACAAADSPPGRGVLIAREKGSSDRFVPAVRLAAPRPEVACAELERLAALREEWRGACWPVPPRTGWSWLEAERSRPGRGRVAASQCWEGVYGAGSPGERSRPEMVVCFGADLPFDALLDGVFAERSERLYGPLLEAAA
jgi:exonuclease V gamma subunit